MLARSTGPFDHFQSHCLIGYKQAMNDKPHAHHSPSQPRQRSTLERVLRWVGSITAVLSLIFGIQQLVQAITENNANEREITELKQLAAVQLDSGEYAMAWDSANAALKLAATDGTLAKLFGRMDAQTKQLRVVRENVAMAWVDDMHTSGEQKFSDFVDKLLPALEQGTITAEPQRKADLLAHIGWCSFLRSRDGARIDPRRSYEQALQIDRTNPYAHAYLAHWLVWNGGTFEEANEHFAAALNTNRARETVRTLQIASYGNRQSEGDASYVATIVAMLSNHERIDPDWRHRALWHFARACGRSPNAELLADLKKRLAPTALLAAFELLQNSPGEKVSQDENQTKQITACLAAAK